MSHYVGLRRVRATAAASAADSGPGDLVPSRRAHVGVVGGTGSGKTRRVLAPQIMLAGPQAVLAASSKPDLMNLTLEARRHIAAQTGGAVFVLDLAGSVDHASLPADVIPVRYDPAAALREAWAAEAERLTALGRAPGEVAAAAGQAARREASEAAVRLLQTGSASMTPAAVTGGGEHAFWRAQAAPLLTAALLAAAQSGGGIAAVIAATAAPDTWPRIADTVEAVSPSLALRVRSLAAEEPRMRSSVAATVAEALTPWVGEEGDPRRPITAAMIDAPQADADLAEAGRVPASTLFIITGRGPQTASSISLTLDIYAHWGRRGGAATPLLAVIDELIWSLPLSALDLARIVGEGRGLGIELAVALQTTDLLGLRWSREAQAAVIAAVPAWLVLTRDPLLEQVAARMDRRLERTRTTGESRGLTTHETRAAVEVGQIAPRASGEATYADDVGQITPVHLPDLTDLAGAVTRWASSPEP